jgi:hypothetical protein
MNRLSLSQLEEFDPHASGRGVERRFLCPLCGEGKPRDAGHRSLGVNTQSGLWLCHRCEEKGLLDEWRSEKPEPTSRRVKTQRRLRQAFSLDAFFLGLVLSSVIGFDFKPRCRNLAIRSRTFERANTFASAHEAHSVGANR